PASGHAEPARLLITVDDQEVRVRDAGRRLDVVVEARRLLRIEDVEDVESEVEGRVPDLELVAAVQVEGRLVGGPAEASAVAVGVVVELRERHDGGGVAEELVGGSRLEVEGAIAVRVVPPEVNGITPRNLPRVLIVGVRQERRARDARLPVEGEA